MPWVLFFNNLYCPPHYTTKWVRVYLETKYLTVVSKGPFGNWIEADNCWQNTDAGWISIWMAPPSGGGRRKDMLRNNVTLWVNSLREVQVIRELGVLWNSLHGVLTIIIIPLHAYQTNFLYWMVSLTALKASHCHISWLVGKVVQYQSLSSLIDTLVIHARVLNPAIYRLYSAPLDHIQV